MKHLVFGTRRRVVVCRVPGYLAACERLDRVKAANRGRRGLVIGAYNCCTDSTVLSDLSKRLKGVAIVWGR